MSSSSLLFPGLQVLSQLLELQSGVNNSSYNIPPAPGNVSPHLWSWDLGRLQSWQSYQFWGCICTHGGPQNNLLSVFLKFLIISSLNAIICTTEHLFFCSVFSSKTPGVWLLAKYDLFGYPYGAP